AVAHHRVGGRAVMLAEDAARVRQDPVVVRGGQPVDGRLARGQELELVIAAAELAGVRRQAIL
ncbi:MAG: hypothetical protein QG626_550, partial [Patescibacteria group bacterium]|nr:hypothetical protein [Patescibacteria group bacterium]